MLDTIFLAVSELCIMTTPALWRERSTTFDAISFACAHFRAGVEWSQGMLSFREPSSGSSLVFRLPERPSRLVRVTVFRKVVQEFYRFSITLSSPVVGNLVEKAP